MPNSFKKSIFLLATLSLILLVAICGFNYFVNPYGVFDHSLLHHKQSSGRTNVRLVTAYNLKHKKYNGLIFGSSRGSMGVNPNSKFLHGDWYNASLPGASLIEMYYYIQHAAISNPDLNTIIMGLDYYLFDENSREFRKDFTLDRLNTIEHNSNKFKDFFDSLFSIDAVQSSYNTIETLSEPSKFDNGYWTDDNINTSNKSVMEVFEPAAKKISGKRIALDEKKFEMLNLIFSYCQKNNIKLILYFHPIHQFTKSHFRFEDGSDEYLITRIIYLIKKHSPEPTIDLWNFSESNSITNLSFNNKKSLFDYYFEGSHYTAKTGDMILCSIFKNKDCNAPNDFGKQLHPEN